MPAPTETRAPFPVARMVVIGALGGLLSGMFGVGGGIIMVPLLILVARLDERRAATTSLAAITLTSVAGGSSYLVAGNVDLLIAAFVAAGGMAGAFLGSRLLPHLPLPVLRWGFIALLLTAAVRMFLETPTSDAMVELGVGTAFGLVGAGLFMGVAAGLFGIGGGVILVPILITVFGAGDLVAKGTSLVVMLPTALMGTWQNARARLVDLRAAAIVGVAAVGASFAGVAVAFRLSPELSTTLFAILVVVSVTQLAVRAVRKDREWFRACLRARRDEGGGARAAGEGPA